MSLLRADALGLAALASEGTLGVRIAEQVRHSMGRRAGDSELRSWERSLPVLAEDLISAGLGRVEMLVEHALPLSSKRIDVVLAGQHPRTGAPSYLVVELKQWSAARRWEDEPSLVALPAYGNRPVLHPVAQVRGYCEYLVQLMCACWPAPPGDRRREADRSRVRELAVAAMRHQSTGTGRREAVRYSALRRAIALCALPAGMRVTGDDLLLRGCDPLDFPVHDDD